MTVLNKSKKISDLDIKTIVEQVQTGDIQAYTELIRCFQKPIFIKGLENIGNFSYMVSFSAWLYKIAHHHCIDLIKKKNKGYKFWAGFKKVYENQTHIQESRYDNIIHELLEELNVDEKRILLLRSIEEYSFDEIASIMGLKTTTVRKKYERLRKKLMKKNTLGADIYGHSFKTGG